MNKIYLFCKYVNCCNVLFLREIIETVWPYVCMPLITCALSLLVGSIRSLRSLFSCAILHNVDPIVTATHVSGQGVNMITDDGQVNALWLLDLEEFNEWMNEEDYLVDDDEVR